MTLNGQVSGASLGGLAKTSLREQALDQLRNAVTSGEIAPGTRLVETELSAALGISRRNPAGGAAPTAAGGPGRGRRTGPA